MPVKYPGLFDQYTDAQGNILVAGTFKEDANSVNIIFNEVSEVPKDTLTIIASFTATDEARLKAIDVSGTNVGEYTVKINGSIINKKRAYFTDLNQSFAFDKGYVLAANDTVVVEVVHRHNDLGQFNASIFLI